MLPLFYAMGGSVTKCWLSQTPYARYQTNSKENDVDLDHVVGSLLEMDPSMQDRDEGVAKINVWLEEITPEISMSPPQLEISRWKCIKYWEAQHTSDIYGGNDHATGIKLTGSCVRFYFENLNPSSAPRLVIEHCGKSLQLEDSNNLKHVPMWIQNIKLSKWKLFRKTNSASVIRQNDSLGRYNGALSEDINSRYG